MPELTDTQRQTVEAAIFASRKIEAIKLYREAVQGCDLADAKKWVEAREAELRSRHPEKFTASARKAGCVGVLAVVTLVLTATLLSFSVPGLPSASLFLLSPVLAQHGIPVEGVGILIALDAIPDMFKTLANVTAHLTSAVVLDRVDRT